MYGVPHVVCARALDLDCGKVEADEAGAEEPFDPEFLKSMGITENDVIDDKSVQKCHGVCGRKVGCFDPAGPQGDGKLLIFVKEKDKGDEFQSCIYCKVVRLLIYGFMEAEDII